MLAWEDIDDEMLEAVRQRAAVAKIEANVSESLYFDCLRSYWHRRICREFGSVKGLTGILRWPGGDFDSIKVQEVTVAWWRDPEVAFYTKLKSGKWGKTIYTVDAAAFLRQFSPQDGVAINGQTTK